MRTVFDTPVRAVAVARVGKSSDHRRECRQHNLCVVYYTAATCFRAQRA